MYYTIYYTILYYYIIHTHIIYVYMLHATLVFCDSIVSVVNCLVLVILFITN